MSIKPLMRNDRPVQIPPRVRAIIVAVSLSIAACRPAPDIDAWAFKPHAANVKGLPPITKRAVRFAESNARLLVGLHGYVVGRLTLEGNETAHEDDVEDEAAVRGAELGATHYIVVSESNEAELESAGMVWGPNGQMIPTSKIVNHVNAVYMLVRVPQEQWDELPDSLRPVRR